MRTGSEMHGSLCRASRAHEGTIPNESLWSDQPPIPSDAGYAAKRAIQRRRAAYERDWSPMSKVRFVGLDVHADTIAVAIAESGGEVRSHGVISNRLESVRKLMGKLDT